MFWLGSLFGGFITLIVIAVLSITKDEGDEDE